MFLAAKDMHIFLLKWFEKFPSFKSRDLFLTGESYAGKKVMLKLHDLVMYFLDENSLEIFLFEAIVVFW